MDIYIEGEQRKQLWDQESLLFVGKWELEPCGKACILRADGPRVLPALLNPLDGLVLPATPGPITAQQNVCRDKQKVSGTSSFGLDLNTKLLALDQKNITGILKLQNRRRAQTHSSDGYENTHELKRSASCLNSNFKPESGRPEKPAVTK